MKTFEILTRKEVEELHQFVVNNNCKRVKLVFTPNGISSSVVILDPDTGNSKNISDYESW